MPAEKYVLQCAECKSNNFVGEKTRKGNAPKLTLNKFCPPCGKHTKHVETRNKTIQSK